MDGAANGVGETKQQKKKKKECKQCWCEAENQEKKEKRHGLVFHVGVGMVCSGVCSRRQVLCVR